MVQAIYSNPTACAIGAMIIAAGVPVYAKLARAIPGSSLFKKAG